MASLSEEEGAGGDKSVCQAACVWHTGKNCTSKMEKVIEEDEEKGNVVEEAETKRQSSVGIKASDFFFFFTCSLITHYFLAF